MSVLDVSDTLDDVSRFTGLDQIKVNHKPACCPKKGCPFGGNHDELHASEES